MVKECRRCRQIKAHSEFRIDLRNRGGLSSWCRQCFLGYGAEYRSANREAQAERARQRYYACRSASREKNRLYRRAHPPKNPEKVRATQAKWSKLNAHKRRESTARRHAAKLMAIPAWANHQLIAEIYADAARRNGRWHVDHVVPLQSEMVCGLHCEANLEVIPGSANEGKSNRWWPNMFD